MKPCDLGARCVCVTAVVCPSCCVSTWWIFRRRSVRDPCCAEAPHRLLFCSASRGRGSVTHPHPLYKLSKPLWSLELVLYQHTPHCRPVVLVPDHQQEGCVFSSPSHLNQSRSLSHVYVLHPPSPPYLLAFIRATLFNSTRCSAESKGPY